MKPQIKSNQITFIVTSPQHKCLGEWNSYERAPDSAKKTTDNLHMDRQCKKQQTIYIWTDSAKKQQTIYIWTDSAKKQQTIYIWTDSAKKQQTIYIWTDSAEKTTNNLHMDRQCKKNNKQFTYGQTVQKTALEHLQCSRQCKKTTTAIYIWTDSAKKQQTIYIWTDSAKKQQQFTYGQYIFTDCTEDNVQNTHTYTQYT